MGSVSGRDRMNDDGWDRVANLCCPVSVGSRWSCDDQGHRFDRRIHIQYPGQPCTCKNQGPDDLHLTLVEKQPLGFDVLDTIAEFSKKPGSIYIHCHAGMCRGPTVAVVVILSRYGGRWGIGRCMGLVVDAMLSDYKWFPLVPEFYQPVINEIHHWHKQRSTTS